MFWIGTQYIVIIPCTLLAPSSTSTNRLSNHWPVAAGQHADWFFSGTIWSRQSGRHTQGPGVPSTWAAEQQPGGLLAARETERVRTGALGEVRSGDHAWKRTLGLPKSVSRYWRTKIPKWSSARDLQDNRGREQPDLDATGRRPVLSQGSPHVKLLEMILIPSQPSTSLHVCWTLGSMHLRSGAVPGLPIPPLKLDERAESSGEFSKA